MTKAVAITIMAILTACGQPPGAGRPGAAVPLERPSTTNDEETIATLTSDERACQAESGSDTVFVPGIGLVPANEANTYLVPPGCGD